jgi:DNA-binding LacI/PurR family transcriptional regulator
MGIVEIAGRAGVSPATVSRALRGMHHVNEQTRSKIVAAAMELKYPLRSDLIPRELAQRTNRIGVIAPYISRWYFAEAINGIEQSLREAGMDLLLYNFSQVDARQRIFQHKQLRGKVDALIVISMPPTDEEFTSLLSLGIPITTIGFVHEGCTSVAIDDVVGGKVAT